MPPSDALSIRRGRHGRWHWLCAPNDYGLHAIAYFCPALLIGRYLAVTSVDSGIKHLTPHELAEGWRIVGDIAYSPRVSSVETLDNDRHCGGCSGYEEWYVFSEPRELSPRF